LLGQSHNYHNGSYTIPFWIVEREELHNATSFSDGIAAQHNIWINYNIMCIIKIFSLPFSFLQVALENTSNDDNANGKQAESFHFSCIELEQREGEAPQFADNGRAITLKFSHSFKEARGRENIYRHTTRSIYLLILLLHLLSLSL